LIFYSEYEIIFYRKAKTEKSKLIVFSATVDGASTDGY